MITINFSKSEENFNKKNGVYGVILFEIYRVFRLKLDREKRKAKSVGTIYKERFMGVYYMKQKMLSLGDKYNVTNEQGDVVFRATSKLISLSHTKYLLNSAGECLYTIRRKIWDFMPAYIICDNNGKEVCRLKRKFSLSTNFTITSPNHNLEIKGDLFAWSFNLLRNGDVVGRIDKKIIHLADSYKIEVINDYDAPLFIAFLIAIDNLKHNNDSNN